MRIDSRRPITWGWGAAAALALLWPDRIRGPLDGVPLDRVGEAVLVGAVFPALWVMHPRFLRTWIARACIAALLASKIAGALALVQDGWCVRFDPARPFAKDAIGAPHAWDLRADWRAAQPSCSAIMTRSYNDLRDFPAWFFNLPPPSDSFPIPADLPPEAKVHLSVRGYLSTDRQGVLRIETNPELITSISVDGRIAPAETTLGAGVHFVTIDSPLTGSDWRLVPRWNGAELWSTSTTATVRRPSTADLRLRPGIAWLPLALAVSLLFAWGVSAASRVDSVPVAVWTIAASTAIAWLVATDRMHAARLAILALTCAAFVPTPPRLKNLFGAFVMVGVPWLTFVVVCSAPAVGRWVLYEFGHDYWTYQRDAYRIVMQGYWLEGGSPTFYFQPLYRWIAGVLHAVFGDSSVGEWYWDGACLLAGALLSFRIARTFAGFRWGVVAAAMPLAVFVLGTAQDLIGRGLSEISSAGLLSASALCAIRARRDGVRAAIFAGVVATLAFYTRLNNLIAACGAVAFALPLWLPTRALPRPRLWSRRISWRTIATVAVTVASGLLFFAWRTFHYTGVFSVFYGTQRYIVAIWQPGMSLWTVAGRAAHSVMMVLTVNDPPRFDILSLPVVAGAAVAALAICGVPRLRSVPAAAVLYFFACVAGALIAYGWAYTGRFSVHVMPVTCSLTVCGAAALTRRRLSTRAAAEATARST